MAGKFDFKVFLVNHVEKLVGILVFCLAGWGLVSAAWNGTPITPMQLTNNIEKVEADIARNSRWTEEEQAKFAIADVSKLEHDLGTRSQLEYEQYSHSVVWLDPLNPPFEKRDAVRVVPPEAPVADPLVVVVAFPAEEDDETDEAGGFGVDLNTDEAEEVDEDRKRAAELYGGRSGANDQNEDGLYTGGASSLLGFGRGGGKKDREGDRGGFGGGGLFGRRDDREDRPGGGRAAADILPTADGNGEWRAGVSVRMLVDLRRQRQELIKALHMSGSEVKAEQERLIDYQDTIVERRELRGSQWSDWEPLLRDDRGEILGECLGIDVDVVREEVTRPELTMPLPRRMAGIWRTDEVSHPRLVDFKLDPEEQEMINLINATMLAEAETRQQQNQVQQREQRGGYSEYVQSAQRIRNRARGGQSDAEFSKNIRSRVRDVLGDDKFDEQRQDLFDREFDRINSSEQTAADRLLLVRFMDFTTERGVTYQYRVALSMYNPNYGLGVDQLESPEIGQEDTIRSDWSEPTEPVAVPMQYRPYVFKIIESRGLTNSVDMKVYYESDGVLPILENLRVEVGLPIGGRANRDRVDLNKRTLEPGEVRIDTEDYLCAVHQTPRPSSRDFPEMKDTFYRGQAPMAGAVCLVNHRGEIVMSSPDPASSGLRRDELMVDAIFENYQDWKADSDASDLGEGLGGGRGSKFDDDDRGLFGGGGRGRSLQTGSVLGRGNKGKGRGGRSGGRGKGRGKGRDR